MKRTGKTTGKAANLRRRKAASRKRPVVAKPNARRDRADGSLQAQLASKTRELNEALEQQAATADVLKAISGATFDLQAVLDTLVQSAARLCRADRAAIRLLKDGALHHLASYGFTAQQRAHMTKTPVPAKPDRGSIAGRVLNEGRIVQVEDAKAEPDFRMTVQPAFADVRTVLGVPLLRGDALIGLLIFSRKVVEPFTDGQIGLVSTFAAQAVIAIQNTRLFDELKQSLEQQTATSEVLGVISSSPGELEPVFQAMLENATRICDAKIGILFRYTDGAYSAVSLLGVTPTYAEYLNRGPIEAGPATGLGRVAGTKQTVHIVDTQAEQAYADRDPFRIATAELGGARSLLNVPMLKDGELIGAIGIYRQEVRPFTDKQVELVTNFAAQAVIAIENTRLLNELRQRTADLTKSLEQQMATADVLRITSSSPGDLEPVFKVMLENAARVCDAKSGNIFRWDGELLHHVAAHNAPAAFEASRRAANYRPDPITPLGRVLASKSVIHIADLASDEAYLKARHPRVVQAVELGGVHTALAVPMLKDGEIIGAFTMYRAEVRLFTDGRLSWCKTSPRRPSSPSRIRGCLTNCGNRWSSRRRQRMCCASSARRRAIWSRCSKRCSQTQCVFVRPISARYLLPREMSTAQRPGTTCRSAFLQQRQRTPMVSMTGDTALARVARTKRPVQISDVAEDPAYRSDPQRLSFVSQTGARTVICVPMLKDGALVGAVAIYRQEVRPFADNQIELLTNFAAQAVIAIENTRLLNELRQSLEQQTATADVLRVISSSPGELEPVFQAMLENATRICEAKFGTLFRFDGTAFGVSAQSARPPSLSSSEDSAACFGRHPVRR